MRRSFGALALTAALALVAGACGDDDDTAATPATAAGPTATTGTGAATTAPPTTAAPTAAPTTAIAPTGPTGGSAPPSTSSPDPSAGALDLVAVSFVDRAPGEPAQGTLDAAVAALGPPERDSGWGPTECPAFDRARSVSWGALSLHLRAVDGADTFVGASYNVFFEATHGEHRDFVRLPPGIDWGRPMGDVAAALGAQVDDDPVLQREEVRLEGAALSGDATTPPAVLDFAEIGSVPKCR